MLLDREQRLAVASASGVVKVQEETVAVVYAVVVVLALDLALKEWDLLVQRGTFEGEDPGVAKVWKEWALGILAVEAEMALLLGLVAAEVQVLVPVETQHYLLMVVPASALKVLSQGTASEGYLV